LQTKKVFVRITIGALLVAGLFFVVRYFDSTYSNEQRALKPSQLDFTNSNQVQENASAQPIAPPEPEVVETGSSTLMLLSEPEQKLWANFEEILKSKNDSDSRVSNLKNLSPEFHLALAEKYSSLKMEDRNGRGFVVFLISKDLKSAADLEFLQKIYQEAPCLSLENCAVSAPDDSHSEGVNQTTTIYPQLVALYQIEKQVDANPNLLKDPAMRAGILATLKQAEAFPVPAIHDRAEKIRQKFKL